MGITCHRVKPPKETMAMEWSLSPKARAEKQRFFDKLSSTQLSKEFRSSIEYTYCISAEFLQENIYFCELILHRNPTLIKERLPWDGDTSRPPEFPLVCDELHLDMVKYLVKKGANLRATLSKEPKTIVHKAAGGHMDGKDFDELCEFLIKNCGAEDLFRQVEGKWESPVGWILQKMGGVLEAKTFIRLAGIEGVDVVEEMEKVGTVRGICVKEKVTERWNAWEDKGERAVCQAILARKGKREIQQLMKMVKK